ncbi:hypothetical protein KYK29_13155 [Shinella daejeonensis]|uniref:hypothetical protein n=1 Tax=Shinella daejeonensis TaxID=659017 RepID=UPI0020C76D41|nr:hypothetical protein [Shinella daejeonensis]MCP8895873.1 hypothetical protein [Shinella daejeonensis]
MHADQPNRNSGPGSDHLGPTITIREIPVEIMALEKEGRFRRPLVLSGPYAGDAPAIFISRCAAAAPALSPARALIDRHRPAGNEFREEI